MINKKVCSLPPQFGDLGAKRNAEVTALKSAQHNLMWQKLPEMTWQGCNCKQLGHIALVVRGQWEPQDFIKYGFNTRKIQLVVSLEDYSKHERVLCVNQIETIVYCS